jgi:hypothetical protein
MLLWDDPELTMRLTDTVFPVLVATHQVNRVAALAVSAAEMLAFGKQYMAQIVMLREHGLLLYRATWGEDVALARRDCCERLALRPIPWPRACICAPKVDDQRDAGLLRRVRPAVV